MTFNYFVCCNKKSGTINPQSCPSHQTCSQKPKDISDDYDRSSPLTCSQAVRQDLVAAVHRVDGQHSSVTDAQHAPSSSNRSLKSVWSRPRPQESAYASAADQSRIPATEARPPHLPSVTNAGAHASAFSSSISLSSSSSCCLRPSSSALFFRRWRSVSSLSSIIFLRRRRS